MPFRSKKQWRWARATGQPWASRWAHETGSFARLPERAPAAKASADDQGSGAATDAAPGQRKKLSRSEAARHARMVQLGRESPFAARLAALREKKKARGKGKGAPKPAKPETPLRKGTDAETADLKKKLLAKQATPVAPTDAKDAKDAKDDKKKKGGGGGGGGGGSKEKPTDAEKDAAKQQARAEQGRGTAEAVGLKPADYDALRKAADGEGDGTPPAGLVELGLVGDDGLTTDAGRRALIALERGDKAGYQAALQDVRQAAQRQGDRDKAKADREQARAKAERDRLDRDAERQRQELDALEEDFAAGRRGLSYKDQRRLVSAGRARWKPDGSLEFVSATKAWRWAIKAEDDSHTPPAAVQAAARRALERRAKAPPSERGMTAVGLARARDLSNGTPISTATARRMVAYFTRHQKDKQGQTWPQYGKGRQAWDGWGGDAGWRWARGIVRRADTEER